MSYNKCHIVTKQILNNKINKEHKTLKEIAKELNVSDKIVGKYCKEYGIKPLGKNGHAVKSIMGKKFGTLMLDLDVHFIKNLGNNKFYYRFICDCGKKCYRKTSYVKSSNVSCGCRRVIWEQKSAHYDISNTCLRRLRRGAKKRQIKFDITLEDIWNQYLLQNKLCYFSGLKIFFEPKSVDLSKQTASIDRINNNDYYHKHNIVIVHKRINLMKHNMTEEEFMYWCQLVTIFKKPHNNVTFDFQPLGFGREQTQRG